MPTTGEKPGTGDYKCTKCGKVVNLTDDNESLPVCPVCGHKEWVKV
ncbi:zinc ribbon-containing protein [Natronoflexus pectinivorans]|uniref:Putative FmdB family regulatory protein n=1 Tax=Natronoflexus pectinivorans TaxID=682526 RepID=A0A4R2GJ60_9BACT|nr:hypothetical protein [Natronoflexus pectinivorans]TCO08352.1 putative FmdB family regulatory protein [Natronoflexus pectinivorans]